MTHKLLILIAALVLVACAGRTSKASQNANAEPTATESTTELEPLTAEQLAKGIVKDEYGEVTALPELLAKIDVARYREFGLTEIESLDPFVVESNEKIVLKDPETANGGLNGIRFEEWSDKEWLNNNYIRSVRLYLDAYVLGLVKNEAFDKYKDAMSGKFTICEIVPFMGGGAWIHIVFVENPSFNLTFWVYSFVNESNPITIEGYDVRGADICDEPIALTTAEIKAALKENPNNKLW